MLDGSAAVAAFTENTGRGSRLLDRIAEVGEIAVPAHYHVEAASALGGLERGGVIGTVAMFGALRDLSDLAVTEHFVAGPLLYRAMELQRHGDVVCAG